MPAGADKGFTFDPPGAIGLVADDARVLLRFHDPDVTVPPKDEAGALNDLSVPAGAFAPQVVPAACGNGRDFDGDNTTALAAKDLAGGSSLATRDLTIMAIVRWNIAQQTNFVDPGVIVCRGDGSSSSSERICYELRLSVVDLATSTGSIALAWQDTSGTMHVQTGAQFVCPTGFTLLTATRRWASPTSVVCHYYIGDVLLAEIFSSDGDIAGATTGTFTLGAHRVGGSLGSFFAGTLDEIAVFDREMCIEEIADTWQRITVFQPLGVQLFRELHDPGFPASDDPSSDIQLENRQIGMALGYAASLVENFRRNILPQRAYGRVLELWEETVRPVTPGGGSSTGGIDLRRARVLARLRQRGGSSVPALQGALTSLLGGFGNLVGGADSSQLEFLAFSNTFTDGFATLNTLAWDMDNASIASVTATGGVAVFAPDDFGPTPRRIFMQRAVGGDAKQAHQIVKLVFTTPFNGSEAGVYFGNAATGGSVQLGLRDVAGSFQVFTEVTSGGVSLGAVSRQTLGGNPAAIWFMLAQTTTDGTWAASWSTTSASAGFTAPVTFAAPSAMQWAGLYLRPIGTPAGDAVAHFDDHVLQATFGTSPFNAYVLLDRALGFSPDIPGARQCVGAVKHAFIHGTFITAPKLLCDDPDNGCDQAPLGGF